MTVPKMKKIPEFKIIKEEREFWSTTLQQIIGMIWEKVKINSNVQS